jgi:hypothetical protein
MILAFLILFGFFGVAAFCVAIGDHGWQQRRMALVAGRAFLCALAGVLGFWYALGHDGVAGVFGMVVGGTGIVAAAWLNIRASGPGFGLAFTAAQVLNICLLLLPMVMLWILRELGIFTLFDRPRSRN